MDSTLRLPLPHSSSCGGADPLHDLGLLDLLEHDPRPTFVLDASELNVEIRPAYQNAALVAAGTGALLDAISGRNVNNSSGGNVGSFPDFLEWTLHHQHSNSSKHFTFCDYSWRRCLIASRWIVISGLPVEASSPNEEAKSDGYVFSKKRSRSKSRFPTFDWTDDLAPVKLSPHITWARSIDWASTPLGPMHSWSPQLRSNASLIMQDPRPAVGFYGSELIMIYNEAYIELLGGLHPCMGRSARDVLASVWLEHFEPIIQMNLTGETVDNANVEIPLTRNGFLEETYFSTRFIPIFDSDGATIGHYEPVVETVSPRQYFFVLASTPTIFVPSS